MAEDVQATVARLRARAEQAERQRAGAEYARQQAEQVAAEALAQLKSEFGVETPEQARSLLADLDRQLAEEAARIEQVLGA